MNPPVSPATGATRHRIIRRMSMETYMVRVYPGPLCYDCDFTAIEAEKATTAFEIIDTAVNKLRLGDPEKYELAEVLSSGGQLCKERRLEPTENPVRIMLLWPKNNLDNHGLGVANYKFFLRKKDLDCVNRTSSWRECANDSNPVDDFLVKFLQQPNSKEYPDLCNLPDLNERTLLENLKTRFRNSNIYTYVGSILIAVNPFKFFPIYNPKYVKMYQNKRLGELPPHIFAIADAAFYTMLRKKKNQCIVISGESGSGKTESTNLLLHHLTALSQKGSHGSGVEQTILGAGPVLEAFGNAKTIHNNNSSRFGKFIQVNYKENGMVHGAIVEKYLLEKSRIVSQARNERNYHVFYYLLAGAEEQERETLHLGKAEDFRYLNNSGCITLEGEDEIHEFARLKQSMEMVGFSSVTQKRIFSVMSAVLHLGNVEFRKKGDQHHDDSVSVKNEDTIKIISEILKVKEKTLTEALTQKRATAGDETVVMNYRMHEAIAIRDAMAKCLYGALFDWIVLKVNQALLAKRHNSEHQGNSIGVLDIFGFEDFNNKNSFEQFCINYANEHLQYYFNQHIFKFEQEEYEKEGIQWKNIEFIDNTGCLELFSKRPHGLFSLLDEECSFPGATNETLLSKFHHNHRNELYYQAPQLKEEAFVVVHYAGKVKYNVKDFREKNSDLIRQDIVSVLKSSNLSFVRELMGVDPVAVLRWSIVKTLLKSVFAFIAAGHRFRSNYGLKPTVAHKNRKNSDLTLHESLTTNENLLNAPPHSRSPRRRTHSPLHEIPSYHNDGRVTYFGYDDDDSLFIDLTAGEGLSPDEMRKIHRAQRLLKNKSFRPKPKPPTMLRDIKTLKDIASRTMYGGSRVTSKKQPASVGAQFQWSLTRLMSTLQQANPFFVRCIKSNAEKEPCHFDDLLVMKQLRYTGMLATVKIRQSGYNYRLLFEEFTMLYKILLPNGLQSSKDDVIMFLKTMNLNHDNYQIGCTKVFLRESEKIRLDEALHTAIMQRVVRVQRWFKTILERRHFTQVKKSVLTLQTCVRTYIAKVKLKKRLREVRSAVIIQKCVRGYLQRRRYLFIVNAILLIQSWFRGHVTRKEYKELLAAERKRRAEEAEKKRRQLEEIQSSNSDEGVLTTGSSAEKLDTIEGKHRSDSESSGIHEDSEPDTIETSMKDDSIDGVPSTPSSPSVVLLEQPTITLPEEEISLLAQSRVSDLAKTFQKKVDEQFKHIPMSLYIEHSSENRSKRPKAPPAPLAKQESFSDLEPSTPSPLKISPDKLKSIEESLQRNKDQMKEPPSPTGDFSQAHKSPFRMARRHFKNFVVEFKESTSCMPRQRSSSFRFLARVGSKSRQKKESADDSDEEQEGPSPRRPHHLGIQVLPTSPPDGPGSPKSPVEKKASITDDMRSSTEDLKERNRHKKRKRREDKTSVSEKKSLSPTRGNWNLSKTALWEYPADLIITDLQELVNLDSFIYKKHHEYQKNCKNDTIFDVVFKKSLGDFHKEIQATVAIEAQKGEMSIPYQNLLAKFAHTLEAEVKSQGTNASFPVTMGVNAFRGFLDEFIKHHKKKEKEKKKIENKNMKREHAKKKKDVFEYMKHKYTQVQFNIPTFCEYCTNIIWLMEKGSVCQVCKYTCHKKCVTKSTIPCKGAQKSQNPGSRVFGSPLQSLVSENTKIPLIVERLIEKIELQGMYTVGIYRKSGAAAKVKELKQNIDNGSDDLSNSDILAYPIHVLTSLLKMFFRDLPEPLLTFECYDDFIRTSEIQDVKERVQSIYAVIEKLPKPNHDVFERLIYHLARVAYHESVNKMSPNGLAIIFAPALLRTNKKLQAQDSLNQVPRQTRVVEQIIEEQLGKLKEVLHDLSALETAEATAADRLSVVRNSIRAKSPTRSLPDAAIKESIPEDSNGDMEEAEEEERALSSHLQSIRKERENLTSTLPSLECRHHSSDDDGLSTDGMDSVYDTAEEDNTEEYALTFDLPVSPPSQLTHLTKSRVSSSPCKKPPSKYQNVLLRLASTESSELEDMDQLGDCVDAAYLPSSARTFHGREPSWEDTKYVSMPQLQNIGEDEDEIMV